MSQIVKHNQPCLNPECGSHDGMQVYDTGTAFCFSCRKWFKPEDVNNMAVSSPSPIPKSSPKNLEAKLKEIKELPIRGFEERKITKEVTEFFDVRVSYDEDGTIGAHHYPYENGNAYKIRTLPKSFSWLGNSNDLFGREKFAPGGKRLIICEGEIDAMSVAQASIDKYKKIYPVVGLSSSSVTKKSLLVNREWIRSFKEVVWCGDEDEAGYKARAEAIPIIGIDKIKLVKLPKNDANQTYLECGSMALNVAIWDAVPYVPAGIINKADLRERLINRAKIPSVPYPDCLSGVNAKTKGHRGGEIVLFTSGTGSGKSSLLREDILHILKTTEDKIGIVSLEESPEETAQKLAGMVLHKNPSNEEIPEEELLRGYDEVFDSDRIVLLDHQGSINDNSIIDQLEYMCLVGCKYLYIDHITILVSEGADNLSGNEAIDKVMNDLLRLVKRHTDVWIGLVSHLRKVQTGGKSFEEGKIPTLDDIKGSGSIKQISFDVIGFARNLTAIDPIERNTILMSVLKSRHTGLTGPVPGAIYNNETGRLRKVAPDQFTEL